MCDMLSERLTDAMARLDEETTLSCARQMIDLGFNQETILKCLNQGVKEVGRMFECGEYFIADLMVSGMLYRSVLGILPSSLLKPADGQKARVLIGVVEQDIHDIGKDIIVGLLTADNFDVLDLGTDVRPQTFVKAIREYQPQILLLSGMMQFAQDSMKRTIDAIRDAGLRDGLFILLGGGCVNPSILEHVDADAMASEPMETLKYCNEYARHLTNGTGEQDEE